MLNPDYVKEECKDDNLKKITPIPWYIDGMVLLGIPSIGALSIFRTFSNYDDFNQFFKFRLKFSMGDNRSYAKYFFQVTYWNLWICVFFYILVYDMLYKRLLSQKRKSSTLSQNGALLNRLFASVGIGVAFVFWVGMSIPTVLAGGTNAFWLVNTFCIHFIIPLIALVYYYHRNKQLDPQENIAEVGQNNGFIQKLQEGRLKQWLFVFISLGGVFALLSFLLQYCVTTNHTPVYSIIDWHGGPMHFFMALASCIIIPFIFTAILYSMHVDTESLKKENRPKHALAVTIFKWTIFSSTILATSFTISWGIVHNILNVKTLPSIFITSGCLLVVGFFIGICANMYCKGFFQNYGEKLFPKFSNNKIENNSEVTSILIKN